VSFDRHPCVRLASFVPCQPFPWGQACRPRDLRHRRQHILYTSPAKLFTDLSALIAAVPDQTVLLDLPLPAGCWGFLGRASVPYVTRINRTIHHAA
jgi:hypothetical protein